MNLFGRQWWPSWSDIEAKKAPLVEHVPPIFAPLLALELEIERMADEIKTLRAENAKLSEFIDELMKG